jgi:hypothetical protein
LGLDDHERMASQFSEFATGDEAHFLLSVAFEVRISNVGVPQL